MPPRLPLAMQVYLPKRTGPVGLETITWWKDPEITRHRGRLLEFQQRRLRRARRLRPPALYLRRRLLVPRAAVVVIEAVAPNLRAAAPAARAHRRLPGQRPTPRLLRLAAEVGADARTKATLIYSREFMRRKRLRDGSRFHLCVSRVTTNNLDALK